MASVLTLDALGTLVELQPPAPVLRRELAARFGIECSEQQAASALAAEIGFYRGHLDEGRDHASLGALRRRCAEVLRSALPPSDAIAAVSVDALADALLASLRFTAYPDAAPAISLARANGWRVVVASNWDVSLHDVLERLELAPLLDGVVTSAEVGARKPSPAVFERALAIVHARPAETIHVGDSVEDDVIGARGAGIEPVLLDRDGRIAERVGRPAPQGVRVISTLSELELGVGLMPNPR
jgi:putative hydrolase of the HAD superfamily